MNCEIKKAWLVEEYSEPREIYALFDEGGTPLKMAIKEERAFLNIPSYAKIFQSYEDAISYHRSILPTFYNNQLKDYLGWCYDKDKREILEEILPDTMYNELYKDETDDADIISIGVMKEILSRSLRGVINIGPMSFQKNQVSHVRYGKECIEVVLCNGRKVTTRNEIDRIIIEAIFCTNRSGLVYPDVKPDNKN